MDLSSLLVLLAIATALALLMITAPFLVGTQRRADLDTESSYECGFEPFDDSRGRFDIRFYLVAILFIIFDLEVSFLFPWALSLGRTGVFGFYVMMVFLIILTVGFVYEWQKGALDWD
jgi:NADH-quinone oxidoreductase subunit A